MDTVSISTRNLHAKLGSPHAPLLLDVRRDKAFEDSGVLIAGRPVVTYCVHGHEVSQWITRERPKIDRIACPWLIQRFIDPLARFDYVPTQRVFDENDHEMLAQALPVYDGLYAWCRSQCEGDKERHSWNVSS